MKEYLEKYRDYLNELIASYTETNKPHPLSFEEWYEWIYKPGVEPLLPLEQVDQGGQELVLTLKIRYAFEGQKEPPSFAMCKSQLEGLVQFAANRGLLSGDTEMIVEEYNYSITGPCQIWVGLHHHRHGVSVHVLSQQEEPSEEEVIAAIEKAGEEYEEDADEWLEVVGPF